VLAPDLTLLAHHSEPADVRDGPAIVLSRVRTLMRELLKQHGARPRDVIGIGIGVPGPVDFGLGQLVNPPLMPAWDGYSIRDDLRADYAAPVFVDNDVNVMALGELWRMQRALQNFLVIKVGTGIGCGIVCHGEVYRGANGSAGDVGHICVDPTARAATAATSAASRPWPPARRSPAPPPRPARSGPERAARADAGRARHAEAAGRRAGQPRRATSRQRDRAALGRADRPDAGVGRQLPQPVARVHRRRHPEVGPAVPGRGAARASITARSRCRRATSRSSTRRSASAPA
jgi:predicted NBD/HSP70 family sugar kinase